MSEIQKALFGSSETTVRVSGLVITTLPESDPLRMTAVYGILEVVHRKFCSMCGKQFCFCQPEEGYTEQVVAARIAGNWPTEEERSRHFKSQPFDPFWDTSGDYHMFYCVNWGQVSEQSWGICWYGSGEPLPDAYRLTNEEHGYDWESVPPCVKPLKPSDD